MKPGNRCSDPLQYILLLILAVILSGCATAPRLDAVSEKPPSSALTDVDDTRLHRLFSPGAASHAEQSGVLLLDKGEESLLWRGVLTDQAQKSVDVQTFIWADDNVGTIAAERLLRAADRGVRVRVLLDDFMLTADTQYMSWLDQHPQVEIRIYNPLGIPGSSTLTKALSILSNWKRMNRRMHNKLFVVDNSIAIAGGRNISDGYFDMSDEFNYRDRDVLVIGQIVPELSDSFDRYWNSDWAVPLEVLVDDTADATQRETYYAQLREYARHPENYPPRFAQQERDYTARLQGLVSELTWAQVELFVDMPGKNRELDSMQGFGVSGETLTRIAAETEHEILGETPYLITMPGTIELLHQLNQRGVQIHILTNSYRSTDNYPAFGGYVRKRRALLEAGVKLYELRPDPAYYDSLIERSDQMEGRARLGLHAKTAVFDRKRVFIGSFNLDPRSTHLNTEQGLLIESEPFARQVAAILLQDMQEQNSWQLSLSESDELHWQTRRDGKPVQAFGDPDAGLSDLFRMLLFITVPVESIL